MNKFLKVVSLLFCLAILLNVTASCNNNDDAGDDQNNNQIKALSTVLAPSQEIASLFDPKNKIEISIEISESELKQIDADYQEYSSFSSKSPIYRMCDVTISINDTEHFFDEVGIRMKGNTSRRSFYDDESGLYDMIHYKLSFSETFDKAKYYKNPKQFSSEEEKIAREERTFFGMEKLDLKWNKNFDETHIKEMHAYDFFLEHNVLAPRLNKSKVTLITDKGEYMMGVFNMLECVDSTFINRYLPLDERGGDLYKCGWGTGGGASLKQSSAIGIGTEDEDAGYFPTYDLKTNKKTSDNSLLKNMIFQLNSKSKNELDTLFDFIIDENYFLVFEAISYLVGNPDDLRNNYNNYYIYFLPSSEKAIFIPYDYDRVFGLNQDWNPTSTGMTSVDPFTKKTSGGSQESPLYTKTIISGGNERLIAAYAKILNELKNSSYLDASIFEQRYNTTKELYKNDTIPSKNELNWAGIRFSNSTNSILDSTSSNIDFKTYIDLKLTTLNNALS